MSERGLPAPDVTRTGREDDRGPRIRAKTIGAVEQAVGRNPGPRPGGPYRPPPRPRQDSPATRSHPDP